MKLAFMGDVCARGQTDTLNQNTAQAILAPILPVLKQADVRIANWENPTTEVFTPIRKAGALCHSRPQNIGFLTAAQVQVAVLANNHTGDSGPEGLMETMRHLAAAGIVSVGAGENIESAYQPQYIHHNGETAALLAVCEHEFGFARENSPGTAGYDHIRLTRAIRALRPQVDFVVVIFHTGNEYCPIPSPRTVERCRDMADSGADAVVCMHAHCMQGYEEYGNAQIVYGTGNFFFGSPSFPDRAPGWYHGYIPMIDLRRGQKAQMEAIPYQFARDCSAIAPFSGEEKRIMLAYIDRLREPLRDPALLRFLYDGWCACIGESYAGGLQFRAEYREGPAEQGPFSLADLMRCESHHEMLNTYLDNLLTGRRALAREGIEPVLALRQMPVSIV